MEFKEFKKLLMFGQPIILHNNYEFLTNKLTYEYLDQDEQVNQYDSWKVNKITSTAEGTLIIFITEKQAKND